MNRYCNGKFIIGNLRDRRICKCEGDGIESVKIIFGLNVSADHFNASIPQEIVTQAGGQGRVSITIVFGGASVFIQIGKTVAVGPGSG